MKDSKTVLELGTCTFCGQPSLLEVEQSDIPLVVKWRAGRGGFIQNLFPHWSAGRREQLMTGIHEDCWDKWMAEDEG